MKRNSLPLKLENKTNPLTALPFRLSPVEKPRKRAPVKNSKQTKTKTNNKSEIEEKYKFERFERYSRACVSLSRHFRLKKYWLVNKP